MDTDASEDPALAIAARHALDDEELIAAFATDGESVDGAARARSFIERCVAWICKLEHVRETIPYPRMLYRLYP